ncbi:cell division cycle protein 23 homolog [Phlebotomus papatasi]|nr:cell division cycle protein 23 homolog [Phlebotomus papatasi]
MCEDLLNVSMGDVKKDILQGIVECNKRGLLQSAKWLAELNFGNQKAMEGPGKSKPMVPAQHLVLMETGIGNTEYDEYYLAKAYFDCREYDRAAYFTRESVSPIPKFLHLYSRYMAKEKKRLDNMTDSLTMNDASELKDLNELMEDLKVEYNDRKLDGYCLYLYGVMLKKQNLSQLALNVLLEAVNQAPMLWAAWLELSPLIPDKEKLLSVKLPDHWMKHIFVAHTYIELLLNDEGIKQYQDLQHAGFSSFYITSQLAIAHHNKRDVEKAIEIFQQLQQEDPYRLDNLDIYSNLLFVKELKTEMAHLAHKAVEINKYRPETCCVIGNYYSIRLEHQRAISYFQRALKLNPQYLSAWTLMGHEYMEVKNTNAAIQCYRKAIEVNSRDFRAWYGLGQAYEILKMPFYSLYYYKTAQQLRPYDSRMLVALGETYEKLEKNTNALRCYRKACNVGDIEGIALLKLGNLYEKLGDWKNAIPTFLEYCSDDRPVLDKAALYRTFAKLGNYYEGIGNYDEAARFAYRALEHDETKNEAKSLLKAITNKRTAAQVVVPEVPLPRQSETYMSEVVYMEESDMVIESSIINEDQPEERPAFDDSNESMFTNY